MGYYKPRTYSLTIAAASFSPADADTRYFGGYFTAAPGSTAGSRRCIVPRKGFIRSCGLIWYSSTVGTNESIVMTIGVNNTTYYTFSTVGLADANRNFINDSLNIPVSSGDYIEIKVVYPTWVTNPDGCVITGTIIIEAE